MKVVLALAALGEAATGAALLVVPSLVGRLLLGAEFTGVAIPAARVTGLALIGLAVACCPGPAILGMLTYSGLVTFYLVYVALRREWVGLLLWPAVAFHAVLSLLLARAWMTAQRSSDGTGKEKATL